MSSTSILRETWETIKEVDLRPLREQALQGVRIAIIGDPGSGRKTLAEQLRCDPARPEQCEDTPVMILELAQANQAQAADLIILVVDSRKPEVSAEQRLARAIYNASKKVLVVVNQFEPPAKATDLAADPWGPRRGVVRGAVLDDHFLTGPFAQAVITLLPNQLLGLGRNFPLFRVPVAHYLINDACLSNATYALSTGLAETIAVLDIPLTVADMVILTKNQAFLAYRLGLTFGFSTYWQDYLVEFSGVLGGGFLWRQLARSLVGLIPVWGIIPKIAVSYSGTYVVGNAILQWYLTGRHITKSQIQSLYQKTFSQGKTVARLLLSRLPRARLPRLTHGKKPALPAPRDLHHCPACGKKHSKRASFCQYCGQPLQPGASAGSLSQAEIPLPESTAEENAEQS